MSLLNKLFLTCSPLISKQVLAEVLPKNISSQMPVDYEVMSYLSGELNDDKLLDYLVVAHKKNEQATFDKTRKGSPRPPFIFIQNKNATF